LLKFPLIAKSIKGIQIRLTEERWSHIIQRHKELKNHAIKVLSAVEKPDFVIVGKADAFIAVKYFASIKPPYIIVAYREISDMDGFIITAHFISNINELRRRRIVWQKS
jgi:hypothetical protein